MRGEREVNMLILPLNIQSVFFLLTNKLLHIFNYYCHYDQPNSNRHNPFGRRGVYR
jgi:hypothetical protein